MTTKCATDHFVFEELEKRILFSADIGVLAPELPGKEIVVQDLPQYQTPILPAQAANASGSTEQQVQARHEVVFIDGAVENARQLAEQLGAQQDSSRILDVVLLDASKDGVSQISAYLANQHDLNAVHIISHGADGELQLGDTQLNNTSLPANAMAVSGWGAALAAGGDILLYGCDVAQSGAGQQFVDTLGRLTGADIAASNDLTGNAARQGDWTLEYSHGQIETQVAPDAGTQAGYSGILSIFTVSNTADSGAGSLRQAILDANAANGTDTINFSIAGTISLASVLPDITGTVVIDGRTAAGYAGTPVVEITGNGLAGNGLSFVSGSSNSEVHSLAITNFAGNGINLAAGADNVKVQGNYVGLQADGVTPSGNSTGIWIESTNDLIGGTSAADRNVVSGNSLDGIKAYNGASNITIQGNYTGTNAAGTAVMSNGLSGIVVDGASNIVVGGTSAGAGNLSSGNQDAGIWIGSPSSNVTVTGNLVGLDVTGSTALGNGGHGIIDFGASAVVIGGTVAGSRNVVSANAQSGIWTQGNALIEGNYVGTNAAGTAALGNGVNGISLRGAGATVGGAVAGSGNVVSGNNQTGVDISGSTNNVVAGNYIGVAADGVTALGNGLAGVRLSATSNNDVIGGTTVGTGNIIANNSGGGGIELAAGGGSSNSFLGNAIYSNYGLGIDIDPIGPTSNDAGDGDTGPNGLQNFPVIVSSSSTSTNTLITGTLNSTANTTFRIEFFASDNSDASGYGQGQRYLGFLSVATDASGNASYTANLAVGTPLSNWISATATNQSTSDTSEFSQAVPNSSASHAPVGTDNTVTMLEDGIHTFTAAEFGFTDPNDAPANNFQSVTITTVPASGSLVMNNVVVAAGMVVSKANLDAGLLRYAPAANANASTSFTFQVSDDGNGDTTDTTARTMTIAITPVNDAPRGANHAVNTREDVSFTFAAFNFNFSDPNDTPANNFSALVITTIPGAGTLSDNGVVLAAGAVVSRTDIDAGKLLYTPPAGASGSGFTNFTFQVRDDGGTANGGVDTDPTPRNMAINVVPVNDAPQGASNTVATLEDQAYTFAAGDFGFSDPSDSPANNFLAVTISSIPATGTLTDNGATVSAGTLVSRADIDAGLLLYTPAANANGAASFTFRVKDDGGTSNGGVDTDPTARTMGIAITPVNDAPVGADHGVSVTQGAAYTFAAGDFGFTDPSDTPANQFAGVVVSSTPGAGMLSDNGATVSAGMTVSKADIDAGLLVYTPLPGAGGTGAAAGNFTFRVQDDGGTANGGQDTDASARTMTVSVTAAAAPVLTPSSGSINFTPGGGAVAVDAGLTVTDSGSATLASGSVRIGSNFNAAEDALLFTADSSTMGNIAASYNAGTGVLSLSSAGATATVAQWQAALRAVSYTNSAAAPATTIRSIAIMVSDSQASTLVTRDVHINTLVAGDIAVLGADSYNYGDIDGDGLVDGHWAVVALRNLTAGMVINITDAGIDENGNFISNPGKDGHLTWTLTSDVAAGTILSMDTSTGVNFADLNGAVAGKGGLSDYGTLSGTLGGNTATVNFFNTVGDQLILYQGNAGVASGATFIYAYTNTRTTAGTGLWQESGAATSSGASYLPPGLVNGVSAVALSTSTGASSGTGVANAGSPNYGFGSMMYAGTLRAGTRAELLAAIADASSWSGSNGGSMNYDVGAGNTYTANFVVHTLALTTSAGADTYTEQSIWARIDNALTLSSDNNDTIASATVSIGAGFTAAEDFLISVTDPATMGNIGVVYDYASGVMTLTSAGNTATVAQWQEALRSVGYGNSSQNPNTADRAITYSVVSGAADTVTAGKTIHVVAVNNAPTLTSTSPAQTYVEGAPGLVVDAGIVVGDPDNSTLSTGSVAISAGFTSGQDLLAFTNSGAATMGNIAGTYNAATGILSLSSAGGSATLAQWQAALRSVTYSNGSTNPTTASRTINFLVNDGAAHSNASPQTINITAINSAPVVVSSAPAVTQFTENSAPVAVDAGITLSDLDNSTLVSALVEITGNFSNADFLRLISDPATMGDIIQTYNIGPGVATLVSPSGTATLAQWQAALRAVTYVNTSENPNTAVRTVEFSVNDGTASSNIASKTIQVTAVNDAPAGTDHTVSLYAGAPYTFAASDFGFSDPVDGGANNFLSVRIATLPAGGTLTSNGLALQAGDSVLKSDIDAGRLVFSSASHTALHGSLAAGTSFTFQVRDDGGSANGGADTDPTARLMRIAVTAVNNAPAGAAHTVGMTDNQAYAFVAGDFGFSDAGDTPANNFAALLLTSLPAGGSLTLNGKPVSAGTLVLKSELDVGKLLFTPAPYSAGRTLLSFGFRVQDDGGTANGGVDLDATVRLMTLDIASSLIENSGTVVLSPVRQVAADNFASAAAAEGESTAARAAASVAASSAASAATASSAAAAAAASRISIPVTGGARQLAIEIDASIIRANIVRFLGDKADGFSTPAVINLPASAAPEAGSAFKAEVVMQAPVDHRNVLLTQLKTGTSDSVAAASAILPASSAGEEGKQEYSTLRSTAHRIESAIAVSALGTIWVVARKAALVASLLSTVPAWMRLDPLPILGAEEEPEEELETTEEQAQADSVEHLFSIEGKSAEQPTEARPQ